MPIGLYLDGGSNDRKNGAHQRYRPDDLTSIEACRMLLDVRNQTSDKRQLEKGWVVLDSIFCSYSVC